MKIYSITGISGSGKTTVARRLIDMGYVAFDSKITKGIFRFEDASSVEAKTNHANDAKWRSKYKWVFNKKKFQELVEQNKEVEKIFVCGTGNILKYKQLFTKIFVLIIEEETLLNRLNDANRDDQFGKDDDTQKEIARNRLKIQQTLIDGGAIPIDANKSVDNMVEKILSAVN